jgi:endonuclease/exonuclease/phosphatase family metal-dependent hydrolase
MQIKHPWVLSYAIAFLFCVSQVESVENSIVPIVAKYETLENIPKAKYSPNQYAEISSALQHKPECLRVATYNVLFNIYDHNLEEANRWPQRLPRIAELLDEMAPDVLCVQELYPDQMGDLLQYIGQDYAFYSRPCEDNELNGIFYKKERFEVIDSHVWYMTTTPEVPSSETLTMVQLKDRRTGKSVAVFNTHLAFSKIDKRDFQARFIAEHIKAYAHGLPYVLTGDLNTFPNRLDIGNLPFYDGDYVHRQLIQGGLADARDVSILGHLGPLSTFTNASQDDPRPFQGTGTPGILLDHIYVSQGVQVLMHAVQPGTVEGHYPSDHLPIFIDFYLE